MLLPKYSHINPYRSRDYLIGGSQNDYNTQCYARTSKATRCTNHIVNPTINQLDISKSILLDTTESGQKRTSIYTKSNSGIYVGDYVKITIDKGTYEELYQDGKKFRISELHSNGHEIIVEGHLDLEELSQYKKCFWSLSKDDVSPQDIFNFQKENSTKRAKVATYCVKDCLLCI